MKINGMNRYLPLKTLFLICAIPCANAIELTGNIFTNTEYSTNSTLVSTLTEEDISQIVGLSLNVLENRKSVQASANFRIENERYYNNSFSDQTSLTAGFGLFNLDLVESFLNWQTSFTRTELLTNATDTNTPDNREYRNILRTGPTISYQLSRASLLGLNLNYVNVENSDETASDSERADGNLNFKYLYNSMTDMSVNSKYEKVIDGDGADEYESIRLSWGLLRRFSQGEFIFNFGRTRLKPDNQSSAIESNYFDIQLNRKQMFRHDLSLTYLEDISDASIGFESDEQQEGLEDSIQRSVSGNDIVKRKRLEVSADRVLGNIHYTINGFWEDESYEVQQADEKSVGISLNISHRLSQKLTSDFGYIYQTNDFVDRADIGKDKESTYRIGSSYSFTADLTASSFMRFASRQNERNMVREYGEFAIGFGVVWTFL
jgi:hypothetical protein